MNDALMKNQAATGTAGHEFVRGFSSIVRNGVVACVLACTAAGAFAQERDRGSRREDVQQQRERFEAQAQDPRFDRRAYELREDQRRAVMQEEANRSREERRGGRMTPDERRDLRRQINEAGADLYPNARRR